MSRVARLSNPLRVAKEALEANNDARKLLREIANGVRPILDLAGLGFAPPSALNRPSTWLVISRTALAVRPIPIRSRAYSRVPRRCSIDSSPWWPPLLPCGLSRISPRGRSASSTTTNNFPGGTRKYSANLPTAAPLALLRFTRK